MEGFSTKAIHGEYEKEDAHGALRPPVYECVTFEFPDAESLEEAFLGRRMGHVYSRITNPTVDYFERRIRLLSDSLGVIAVSSGMAAISKVILAIAGSGDNIITSKNLFGNTFSLFEKTLGEWGLEVRYDDLSDSSSLAKKIDSRTRAIFFETITNPQMEVPDAQLLSRAAEEHQILLVADNTCTTPYLFPAKKFGVHVDVISSTKYISGGATCVGGLIIDYGAYDWKNNPRLKNQSAKFGPFALIARLRQEVYRNTGACLSPHNAYLQALGLETMALRIDKSCDNTLAIAEYLKKKDSVLQVDYPGLKDHRAYEIARRQFSGRSGGVLTFDLKDKKQCFNFMNNLKIVRRATNLNDNKTLVLHPASTIYCEYDARQKQELGVRESMLRLAVGIEDVEDIIGDIGQALEVLS